LCSFRNGGQFKMANKLPSTKYVTLSEALSWATFGNAQKREALNKELAGQAFGIPYNDAKQRLEKAVSLLVSAALDGKVKLNGKYLSDLGAGADDEVTEEIPTIKFSDFKQFDITVDGLRFGSGLAWLPDEKTEWIVKSPKRVDGYIDVTVQCSDLRRVFSAGGVSINGTNKQALPRIGEGTLRKWYDNLKPDEKDLSEEMLKDLAIIAFPMNNIIRDQIRKFTKGRPPGRKPNPR
jgi:hypothetical protein